MTLSTNRPRIIGLAGGALWLIAASAVFTGLGLRALQTAWATPMLIGAFITFAVLAAFGAFVLRAALNLPAGPRTLEDGQKGRRFLFVFAAEIGACAVVARVLTVTRHFDAIPSAVLIIVGLHFLPLARIFLVPRYYVLGVLFSAISVITLVAFPHGALVGHALARYEIPSLACGCAASLTAVASLREAWQLVERARRSLVVGSW